MSLPYSHSKKIVTPPSSFVNTPLTPPPTDRKPFAQARQVIALFRARQAGKQTKQDSWIEFQLVPGEYAEVERLLSCDKPLSGYVKDKIRYDIDLENHRLIVRMPTGVHELFIDGVEDAIRSQLKAIRSGTGKAADFADKVRPARSTEIYFPVENGSSNTKSKYEPDTSFWHDDAQYPGIIVEVAYSQKKKILDRLAEDYLLDSDASVQVVVGLDIEYGKKKTKKATFSVWRARLEGDELQVAKVVADEAFRDEQGNPTIHPGLQLHLSDFACEELTQDIINCTGGEIIVSTSELCQYLDAAELKMRRQDTLVKHNVGPGTKKKKRLKTPPEEITSSDEAKYVEQEERATKRTAADDSDYDITSG